MKRSQRNIRWIETQLRIPDGPNMGQPFALLPWQRNIVVKIYDNPVPTRLAIISKARKNGKTALSSALLLLHFVGPESLPNSQLYSAARTRDQAGLVFDYSRKMIEQNELLARTIQMVKSQKKMRCEARGTEFKALSADAPGAFGLNPVFTIHDELGQVVGPKDDLYDAMESAMGAQAQPLSVIISTQAATDDDLLSILIDDTLEGFDPSSVCILHSADDIKDPFTLEGLEAANPALHEFMNVEETVRRMDRAKRLPSSRVSFQNLNLNMRVSTNAAFITREEWMACWGELPPMAECDELFAGLDLSQTRDMTAFVVVGHLEGTFYVYPKMWLPDVGLEERAASQRVPFIDWRQSGALLTTRGKTIQQRHVIEEMFETYQLGTLRKVAYDRWYYKNILNDLILVGFEEWQVDPDVGAPDEMLFEMFGQGYAMMSPALRTAEELIIEGRVVHGNNPVLNWNLSNAAVMIDPAGNRKLNKANDKRSIDGAIAMIMALAVAHREVGEAVDPNFKFESLFEEV